MSTVTIIENNNKSKDEFGLFNGFEEYVLTKKDIRALLDGKALAGTVNSGEFAVFIILEQEKDVNDQN